MFGTKTRFNPARALAGSFLAAILIGAWLLWLPLSTRTARLPAIDAVFTSTSAVCVTGLIVRDTPTFFSPFGLAVILGLIQIGGLGVMTFTTLLLLAAGRPISLRDRIAVGEDFHHRRPSDFGDLVGKVFLYTFVLEGAGAAALFLRFGRDFPPPRALGLAVFHSVSAFCNAGFSLFSDNFIRYREDPWINAVIMALIILGGLGFLVLREIAGWRPARPKRRRPPISLHARVVLKATAALLVISSLTFFLLERGGALRGLASANRILAALFQSVTARTAGFTTIPLEGLGQAALVLMILWMFIGTAPGSTGGGVKVTTVAVFGAFLRSKVRGRRATIISRKSVSQETVAKAMTVLVLGGGIVAAGAFLIILIQPAVRFLEALFETASAFGTVGLSLNLTPRLVPANRLLLSALMFIGRIGPIVLVSALARPVERGHVEFLEETIMIG